MNNKVEFNFVLYSALAVLGHTFIWISLPMFLDGSIRRDVAEGVADGPLWELIYLRHPPLSSWLTGIASQCGAYRYFVLYLFGSLFSAGAFLSVSLFLKKTISPAAGILGLLIGLMSPFGTYIPLNFNHNITSLLFWGLGLLLIWQAFQSNKLSVWVASGTVIGVSLWAKYAILQLYFPILLFVIWRPEWRIMLFQRGPWIALFIVLLIISPQIYHYAVNYNSAINFALTGGRTLTSLEVLRYTSEFILNVTTIQLGFVLLPLAYGGFRIFSHAVMTVQKFRSLDLLGQYIVTITSGPVMIIFIAAILGRRPHFLWLTTLSVTFVAFWAYTAWHSSIDHVKSIRRVLVAAIALEAFNVFSFISVRLIAPTTSKILLNQEIDSRELTRLAMTYWNNVAGGKIPFIVSIGPGTQRGYQRAGGIAFDLPYRVNILPDGNPKKAPWLDLSELEWNGALIVSQTPIPSSFSVLGQRTTDRQEFEIPVLRNAPSRKIFFARSIPEIP